MERRIFEMKDMKTRETENEFIIEGYFAKFDEPYEICPGWIETIQHGAFKRYLENELNEVKVLWNHNHDLVLGSRINKTAILSEDNIGLHGKVVINRNDTDATNSYHRISRGDVSGCSFGFDVYNSDDYYDDKDIYHTVIREVYPLYEVSPCVFPAYESTTIQARAKDKLADLTKKRNIIWKQKMMSKLKGE